MPTHGTVRIPVVELPWAKTSEFPKKYESTTNPKWAPLANQAPLPHPPTRAAYRTASHRCPSHTGRTWGWTPKLRQGDRALTLPRSQRNMQGQALQPNLKTRDGHAAVRKGRAAPAGASWYLPPTVPMPNFGIGAAAYSSKAQLRRTSGMGNAVPHCRPGRLPRVRRDYPRLGPFVGASSLAIGAACRWRPYCLG